MGYDAMRKDTENERTSETVTRISLEIPAEGITFKDFLELIGEQGGLLSCIVLVAPFLFPVSFPGSSIPFGLGILLINVGIISRSHPLIPKKIMDYKISQNNMLKILNGMGRVLSGLDKITKPRLKMLADGPFMDYINSSVMILCALLLMLPLPVPLTDFLPAYSILFLSLGSIERDGYLILAGYLLATITAIYFILIAIIGLSGIKAILTFLGINL
jgi:hypothetical protein